MKSSLGENKSETEYVLSSCAGRFVTSGRRASGYIVESLDGSAQLEIPEIIEYILPLVLLRGFNFKLYV
jgi:hypothetical protein